MQYQLLAVLIYEMIRCSTTVGVQVFTNLFIGDMYSSGSNMSGVVVVVLEVVLVVVVINSVVVSIVVKINFGHS